MDQPSEAAEANDSLDDQYAIAARVTYGGMATLYYGQRLADGVPVAVKVMHAHLAEDPHLRKMFLHEAKLAERLQHPNMVEVYGTGEDLEHGVYMVMEYVEGGTLGDVMKEAARRETRLPPAVVARMAMDLCHALHAAHALMGEDGAPLHLVHRDVSPQNVLVGIDGKARLVDFGIAKSDDRYTKTRQGELKGKLAYMSPERLAKTAPVDRRVDVFAAGIVLWEALLTRRLFNAESEMAVVDMVLDPKVPPPSRFAPELAPYDEVVKKALAKHPRERYSTASDLADGIARAAEAVDGVADRATCAEVMRDFLAAEVARRRGKIEDGPTLDRIEVPPEDDTVLEGDAFSEETIEEERAALVDPGPLFPPDEVTTPEDARAPAQAEPVPRGDTVTAQAMRPSDGRWQSVRWIVLGAVACVLLGVAVGVAIVAGGDDDSEAGSESSDTLPSFDPYAVALAGCREALDAPDPAEARAQAHAALAARPGDAEAEGCRASAEALQNQADIFARGQGHLVHGETHQAFNELQRLPPDSPYRRGDSGRMVARAVRTYAAERLRDAERALHEEHDPDEALRIAQLVQDIVGITANQAQQARAMVAAAERTGEGLPTGRPDVSAPDPTARRTRGRGDPGSRTVEPRQPRAEEASPAEPGAGSIQSRLDQAVACTARGDNACVIRVLSPNGGPQTPRGHSLLIEAYRAMGRSPEAYRHMSTFVARYPDTAQARAYQQLLDRSGG